MEQILEREKKKRRQLAIQRLEERKQRRQRQHEEKKKKREEAKHRAKIIAKAKAAELAKEQQKALRAGLLPTVAEDASAAGAAGLQDGKGGSRGEEEAGEEEEGPAPLDGLVSSDSESVSGGSDSDEGGAPPPTTKPAAAAATTIAARRSQSQPPPAAAVQRGPPVGGQEEEGGGSPGAAAAVGGGSGTAAAALRAPPPSGATAPEPREPTPARLGGASAVGAAGEAPAPAGGGAAADAGGAGAEGGREQAGVEVQLCGGIAGEGGGAKESDQRIGEPEVRSASNLAESGDNSGVRAHSELQKESRQETLFPSTNNALGEENPLDTENEIALEHCEHVISDDVTDEEKPTTLGETTKLICSDKLEEVLRDGQPEDEVVKGNVERAALKQRQPSLRTSSDRSLQHPSKYNSLGATQDEIQQMSAKAKELGCPEHHKDSNCASLEQNDPVMFIKSPMKHRGVSSSLGTATESSSLRNKNKDFINFTASSTEVQAQDCEDGNSLEENDGNSRQTEFAESTHVSNHPTHNENMVSSSLVQSAPVKRQSEPVVLSNSSTKPDSDPSAVANVKQTEIPAEAQPQDNGKLHDSCEHQMADEFHIQEGLTEKTENEGVAITQDQTERDVESSANNASFKVSCKSKEDEDVLGKQHRKAKYAIIPEPVNHDNGNMAAQSRTNLAGDTAPSFGGGTSRQSVGDSESSSEDEEPIAPTYSSEIPTATGDSTDDQSEVGTSSAKIAPAMDEGVPLRSKELPAKAPSAEERCRSAPPVTAAADPAAAAAQRRRPVPSAPARKQAPRRRLGGNPETRKYSDIYPSFQAVLSSYHEKTRRHPHRGGAVLTQVEEESALQHQWKQYSVFAAVMRDYATVFSNEPRPAPRRGSGGGTEVGASAAGDREGGGGGGNPSACVYRGNAFSLHYGVKSSRPEVCDIVVDAFNALGGWSELPSGLGLKTTWNLLWTWSRPRIGYGSLLAWQRVNHFPGSRELTRKDLLKRHIQRFQKINNLGARAFHITPDTYILPHEFTHFVDAFTKGQTEGRGRNVWIMKPVGLSRGRGISLVNDLSSVVYSETMVVQRYIPNPLLLDGYKFDLRIYVLVTSFNPLEAFIYEEGFVRMSLVRYSSDLADIGNLNIHLTNSSIQKVDERGASRDNPLSQADEREAGGTKLTLSWLWKRLASEGRDVDKLKRNMREVILKSLVAVEDHVPFQPNAFELFGYDILFDADLKPWLIESGETVQVNASPQMNRDNALDHQVKDALIRDTVALVAPLPYDRDALMAVLERRLQRLQAPHHPHRRPGATPAPTPPTPAAGGKPDPGGGGGGGDTGVFSELDLDLSAVLRGNVPRAHGEEPEARGGFAWLCPGTPEHEKVSRLRDQLTRRNKKNV